MQSVKPSIKDTTLRSIIFGKKDLQVVSRPSGQSILAVQVDGTQFTLYENTLKVMAQLSRIVYCDSGIIRETLLSNVFGTPNNLGVNAKITELDAKYNSLRRVPSAYPGSKDGRPMQSYVINPINEGNGPVIARYISSPNDFTCLFVPGSTLRANTFFKETDLVIVFKGSSTGKNFKHDLYSQFTPADISKIMPPGTTMSIGARSNNIVPASFIKPILECWELLKKGLMDFNPKRVFITGHSLGGAFASLFTFIMAEIRAASFPSIQSIHNITFGAPTILGDGARNTFNAHLDNGIVTLDRVTSMGIFSKLADVIPSIPVGFSHPGFQPLRTEIYPEARTGRAYTFETIRKVYQKGAGILNFISDPRKEKRQYEIATITHMPNRVVIPAKTKIVQAFTHAEYYDMTYLGAFRLAGMKNPGIKASDGKYYTFVADLFSTGVKFNYVPTVATIVATDPTDTMESLPEPPTSSSIPVAVGGKTSKRRRHINKRNYRTRKN